MKTAEEFRKKALSPFFNLFLIQKLPLAFIAGVRLQLFNNELCSTSIKFRWINKNPFSSLYFAALQMAAELSTGLLLFQYLNKKQSFSMLLVSVKSTFTKKAVGKISFTCNQGQEVEKFVNSIMRSESGKTILLSVLAKNETSEEVAHFEFEWACKKR